MSIALTTPETYASSSEARIVALSANIEDKVLVIVVAMGRTVNGDWKPFREKRLEFTANTTPSFNQVVNATPQFRDLRNALETYLVCANLFQGTVS